MTNIKDTAEYKAIQQVYGERKAVRSKVPYMNHIDEGCAIIEHYFQDELMQRAFCLHPIYQVPEFKAIADRLGVLRGLSKTVKFFADDYGFIANQYLAKHPLQTNPSRVNYGQSEGLRRMLVGDKIQNYKDFVLYHFDTHENGEKLNNYFINL